MVGDKLIGNGMSLLYYDESDKVFRQKSFHEYGFVLNYNEIKSDESQIILNAEKVESQHPDFEGTQFRFSNRFVVAACSLRHIKILIKKNDSYIVLHLEMAQTESEFFTFWKADYKKTS